jgi:hypothetical protein
MVRLEKRYEINISRCFNYFDQHVFRRVVCTASAAAALRKRSEWETPYRS